MNNQAQQSATQMVNPSEWVDRHGDALYRYAMQRVHDGDTAEDLVQQTFLAALQGCADFAGRSSERTWLVAVLRRKIVDHWRQQARTVQQTSDDQPLDEWFDQAGRWRSKPDSWPSKPVDEASQEEFWQTMEQCMSQLPLSLKRTFVLREMEEMPSPDLCKVLSISSSNLWTRLHRARMLLRQCLEEHWF